MTYKIIKDPIVVGGMTYMKDEQTFAHLDTLQSRFLAMDAMRHASRIQFCCQPTLQSHNTQQLSCTSFHYCITTEANNMNAHDANNNANMHAVYAFAIPASKPVANAAAALLVTDAPGIKANAPIVLSDLTACIREVESRNRLMTEFATVTCDEVALSVVRHFVVAANLAAVHYHRELPFAGAPPRWTQEFLEQEPDIAAELAALTRGR
jgi:hypothetical protein